MTLPNSFQDYQCDPKIALTNNKIPDLERLLIDVAREVNSNEWFDIGHGLIVPSWEFLNIAHHNHQMSPKQTPEMTIEIDNRSILENQNRSIHKSWCRSIAKHAEARYMPCSTRSNKETQLIFSPDPASLERTIRKEACSLSTNNNNSVSLDSTQPPSTQTPVPSTDSCSPLSIDKIDLSSTDNLHSTSIDTPSRTSIDTEPRAMVAPLILVRDNKGDLHNQEGRLRNAAGES
ncbi:hypothetical protein F2Q70_00029903 [Brassica cretica]|uniref:Uncharacterized protein n=1 Tax=Brassica cretica TaxID=69181 RepID=A0A8S9FJS3_BRACR|nr:hypothetical protein F2Q70_00029903 [Brassica cretica]